MQQGGLWGDLEEHLPHKTTSPHLPSQTPGASRGGLLIGAGKPSTAAWMDPDPALAEDLRIEVASRQSSSNRVFGALSHRTATDLGRLLSTVVLRLPSLQEGYTLDRDSWSPVHEDGRSEGGTTGRASRVIKPTQRLLIAALVEGNQIAEYWLPLCKAPCAKEAGEATSQTLESMLPAPA